MDNENNNEEFVGVALEVDGVKIETFVDLATYNKLINDPEFQLMYHSQLLAARQKSPPLDTENSFNTVETDSHADTNDELHGVHIQKSSSAAAQNFKWSNAATKLLIDARLQANADFIEARKSYNKYWDKIVTIFAKYGYSVTREESKSKWKNLLVTYNRNVDKLVKTGESSIEWEFFEQMHETLGCRKNVQPPIDTLGSTIQIQKTNKTKEPLIGNFNKADLENISENNNDEAKDPEVPNNNATDTILSTKEYSRKKLQRKRKGDVIYELKDMLSEKKDKALEQQRLMWEEKKAIEKNRTNAIFALADAISGLKRTRRKSSDDEQ